jgi:DNA-directed RNA polymerase subunit RPC12/RpoP
MCKEIREKFQELYSLNVNEYVEKKNDLSYLSWAYAWAEFKKIYPDAVYTILKDEEGRCYFGDENVGYMVYTNVSAGGLSYEMWLPVMDGANKSMKLNSYTYSTRYGEKTVEAMTMFDVNKTVMRCLVKNLAMFGLGLYIYAGEDLPTDIKEYVCADCGKAVDSSMAARTQKAFGVVLCKDCGVKRSEKAKEKKGEGDVN